MKFRIIYDIDEITIITEDGGIACIRESEHDSDGENRVAVTDYYQSRFTDLQDCKSDNVFELLAEGKMYWKDWYDAEYNSLEAIQDALNWLCLGHKGWEITENLFTDLFPNKSGGAASVVPSDYLAEIGEASLEKTIGMLIQNPEILSSKYLVSLIKSKVKSLN